MDSSIKMEKESEDFLAQATKLREKEEALKKVEELQETIKKLSRKVFFEDELRDFYALAEDDLFDTESHIEEEAERSGNS